MFPLGLLLDPLRLHLLVVIQCFVESLLSELGFHDHQFPALTPVETIDAMIRSIERGVRGEAELFRRGPYHHPLTDVALLLALPCLDPIIQPPLAL